VNERQLRIEIVPGQDPMARISGQSFSLNGKVIELDLGYSKEKKLEAVYVSNNTTNYNINAPGTSIAQNQNIVQNSTIIDSFNSIIQEVDKGNYTNSDKEAIKTALQEIK
jgi:hypothetical protein